MGPALRDPLRVSTMRINDLEALFFEIPTLLLRYEYHWVPAPNCWTWFWFRPSLIATILTVVGPIQQSNTRYKQKETHSHVAPSNIIISYHQTTPSIFIHSFILHSPSPPNINKHTHTHTYIHIMNRENLHSGFLFPAQTFLPSPTLCKTHSLVSHPLSIPWNHSKPTTPTTTTTTTMMSAASPSNLLQVFKDKLAAFLSSNSFSKPSPKLLFTVLSSQQIRNTSFGADAYILTTTILAKPTELPQIVAMLNEMLDRTQKTYQMEVEQMHRYREQLDKFKEKMALKGVEIAGVRKNKAKILTDTPFPKAKTQPDNVIHTTTDDDHDILQDDLTISSSSQDLPSSISLPPLVPQGSGLLTLSVNQLQHDPNTFIITERWRSIQDMNRYQNQQYYLDFINNLQPLLQDSLQMFLCKERNGKISMAYYPYGPGGEGGRDDMIFSVNRQHKEDEQLVPNQ